jgi:hypothetical protein
VPEMSIASPERWWRAVTAPLIALWAGWVVSGSVHVTHGPGPPIVRIVVSCAAAAAGLWPAFLVTRTRLTVSDHGLADHRMFRVVGLTWEQVEGFEVGRPGALWGGYCVIALCRDGTNLDLLSTRAYSRVPAARHLDEVHRISWTLEARLQAVRLAV